MMNSLTPLSILLVDDDIMSIEFLKVYFEQAGHTVLSAGSAAEANELLIAHQPTVLLTDLNLGDACGSTLAAKAKTHCPHPILILGMSGYSLEDLASRGTDTSAFHQVFLKPLDLADITKLLEAHSQG